MTRHSPDLLSLVFGLLFVAAGLVLLSGDSGALSLTWVGPLMAIVIGVLLVVAARSTRPTAEGEQAEAEEA